MNREALDALLIDRALGALEPDVESLLAAYIELNPETAVDSDQAFATVGLVRGVLREGDRAPLPDFDAPRKLRRQTQRRYTLTIAGTAAALAIGLMVVPDLSDPPSRLQNQAVQVAPKIQPTPNPESGIWSITPARLERLRSRSAPSTWDSSDGRSERIHEEDPI